MKKTLFFCIVLTISVSLFAATNSNTKKTVKKVTQKKVEIKKTETKEKKSKLNANAKKETKNIRNVKSNSSKTESKKEIANTKNSKSNSIKESKVVAKKKVTANKNSKPETEKKRNVSKPAKYYADADLKKESAMVKNLNTMYENSDKNTKIGDTVVAETFERELEERAQYSHFQTGMASFYGGKWHGKKTANGEIFNQNSLTAAHRSLPFGTRVKVTNLDNGKSVVVRINNRGPYSNGRIIDLSKAAFAKIANTSKGVTKVKLEVAK